MPQKIKPTQPQSKKNNKNIWWYVWIVGNVIWTVLNIFFSPLAQRLADDVYDAKLQQPVQRILGVQDHINDSQDDCDYFLCDKFDKPELWGNFDRFDYISKEPVILKYLESNVGSIAMRAGEVPLVSETVFEFTSETTNINVFIRHGSYYDLIIGDKGNSRISLKIGNQYVYPVGYTGHFPLKEGIASGSLVSVHEAATYLKDTNRIRVSVLLSYYDKFGNKQDDIKGPDFIVPVPLDPIMAKGEIGIGVLHDVESSVFEPKLLIVDKKL